MNFLFRSSFFNTLHHSDTVIVHIIHPATEICVPNVRNPSAQIAPTFNKHCRLCVRQQLNCALMAPFSIVIVFILLTHKNDNQTCSHCTKWYNFPSSNLVRAATRKKKPEWSLDLELCAEPRNKVVARLAKANRVIRTKTYTQSISLSVRDSSNCGSQSKSLLHC